MDARRKTMLFRQVNDTIDELLNRFGANDQARFYCECGSARCAQRLELTTAEFEEIRARGAFVVSPECVGLARVIEQTERYAAVECFRPRLSPVAA
jgi:hypothetical protein